MGKFSSLGICLRRLCAISGANLVKEKWTVHLLHIRHYGDILENILKNSLPSENSQILGEHRKA